MIQKLTLNDLPINGKKVLMRVDFNVPIENGNVTDNTRIAASLPSIRYILEHGAALILMSHLGRPKGTVAKEFSLAPCAKELSRLLGKPVKMAPDCIGPKVEELARGLKSGEVLMLENLRFHAAEEKPEKDPSFAQKLAKLGNYYVDDAFGTAHRAHSSTFSVPKLFPGKAAAGFLLEREIEFLGSALTHPKRPFIAIIGGAKISTKLNVLKSLLGKVDTLLIGGGMAFTFFKAQGKQIGKSICEDDLIPEAKNILKFASEQNVKLVLPVDTVAVPEISENAKPTVVDTEKGIPSDLEGVDIGPKTIRAFEEAIKPAQTILWNGPLGVFGVELFAKGTEAIAKAVASTSAVTIAGGGETIAAINKTGVEDKFTHLSTGGGATLEYIEFGTLPGIEALSDKIS